MKKTLLLIVSLLFLLVNCGLSSKKKPPKPNPKQGIKTETVKLYNYKEKDSTFYEVSTTIFKYNSRGNPVEKLRYFPDGELNEREISKYDSNGTIVENLDSMFNSNRQLWQHLISKYDSMGNEVKWFRYNSDDIITARELYNYKYDSNGNKVERSQYAGIMLIEKIIYKYDSNGNMIKRSKHNRDGSYGSFLSGGSIITNKFDSNGNWVKQFKYGEDKSVIETTVVEYNLNGNYSIITTYDGKGTKKKNNTKTSFYKYDSVGNMIEKKSFIYPKGKSSVIKKEVFKYNSRNLPIESIYYHGVYRLPVPDILTIPYRKEVYQYEVY